MSFSKSTIRQLPQTFDEITQETFHASVVARHDLTESLRCMFLKNPSLITELLPLETELKSHWHSKFTASNSRDKASNSVEEPGRTTRYPLSWAEMYRRSSASIKKGVRSLKEVLKDQKFRFLERRRTKSPSKNQVGA